MTYFNKSRSSLPAFEDKPVLSLTNTRNIERTFKTIKMLAKDNKLTLKKRIKLHKKVVESSLDDNKLPFISNKEIQTLHI